MNDDPTAAASTARLPTRDESDSDSDSDSGVHDDADNGEGTSQHPEGRPRRSRNGRRRSSSRVRRAKAGITKKLEFMTNLMSSLDVLVFAELSVLYYMDCSFARLVLRSLVQYMYLTPKPEDFLKLMPAPRPQMYTIFASNIICMLLHIFSALPEASETMRGYLHGSTLIDFIGQKAPTSRFSLLLLDCIILIFQCVMCAVWLEKDKLKKIEATLRTVAAGGFPKKRDPTSAPAPTAVVDVGMGAGTSTQDLDSEERGILRDNPLGADETNDIEMRPLMNEHTAPSNDGGGGGSGSGNGSGTSNILEARYQQILRTLGGSHSTEGPDRPSLIDVLMSGNGLLANFHVVHAIRTLIADNASDPVPVAGYPLQLSGYTTRLAALAAEGQRRARQRS